MKVVVVHYFPVQTLFVKDLYIQVMAQNVFRQSSRLCSTISLDNEESRVSLKLGNPKIFIIYRKQKLFC